MLFLLCIILFSILNTVFFITKFFDDGVLGFNWYYLSSHEIKNKILIYTVVPPRVIVVFI